MMQSASLCNTAITTGATTNSYNDDNQHTNNSPPSSSSSSIANGNFNLMDAACYQHMAARSRLMEQVLVDRWTMTGREQQQRPAHDAMIMIDIPTQQGDGGFNLAFTSARAAPQPVGQAARVGSVVSMIDNVLGMMDDSAYLFQDAGHHTGPFRNYSTCRLSSSHHRGLDRDSNSNSNSDSDSDQPMQ